MKKKLLPKLTIAVAIILISALHFLTPLGNINAHQVYQRLYYLPVVAAALLFGLRGGFAAAAFATIAYVPHIAFQWHHKPEYALNQYAEIVLFFSFALVTGILSDRTKRETARAEKNAVELKTAYAELRQTFEQLLRAERFAALGELSAGIVHEIRNPLAAIKGAVEILEDELASNNPRREFAVIAKLEVDRINKLVQEFVEFARPPKLVKNLVNINETVTAVSSLLESQITSQSLSVVCELAENLPPVLIDAEQIKQVLLNIALNALQAMSEGGKLTFRTSQSEKIVIVTVEDTGGGIASAQIERIFDPFFTTKEKGLGLGLSIAYKIAAQHKGNLSVENGNHGAILTLTLPVSTI